MTPKEINTEFEYRLQERLGILIQDTREPTKLELEMAREEAFQAIEQIKKTYE